MKELIEKLLKLQTLQLDATSEPQTDRIAKMRGKIPAPILTHYDRLAARGKKGVAAVRNQVCTGCHMQVPLGVTMSLMRGDDVQICESCGRYLYLAALAPVEAPKPAKRAKRSAGATGRKPELQAV